MQCVSELGGVLQIVGKTKCFVQATCNQSAGVIVSFLG